MKIILHQKHRPQSAEWSIKAEGVPRVGQLIDDGGQHYMEVIMVHWRNEGILFPRLVPVVTFIEHDRADEAYDEAYDRR